MNQNSPTQTGTGEAKKLFEEKIWLTKSASAKRKKTGQTASKAIRTEKDNAAESNANRKPKNMCKSYSKRQISNSKIAKTMI